MDKKFTRWIEQDYFESEKKFTKRIKVPMKKRISLKKEQISSFETKFTSHQGEIENHITLVMCVSKKPCERCRYYGRVFKILGIADFFCLNVLGSVAPDREMVKIMQKEIIGKSFCLDCLL